MHKKLIAACMSLAALAAFAMPAIASASPALTDPPGTLVPAGTSIVGTNVGETVLTTSAGPVTCTTARLAGTLTSNTGTFIAGEITSASFTGTGASGRCTTTIPDGTGGNVQVQVTPEALPWCLTSKGVNNEWHIRGGGCNQPEATLPFTFDLFSSKGASLGSCTYERTATEPTLTGTFTTNTTPAHLTVTSNNTFKKHSGSILCPASGTLDATFALETTNGVGFTIS